MIERERGFSLLEMIAALTILAVGSAVLFAWLGQTTNQLARFQAQEKESLVRLRVADYLSTLNPVATPSGKQDFDAFSIEWNSAPIGEMRESISNANGIGLYRVGLFDVQASVADSLGKDWFDLRVKLVGYEQVRQPGKSGVPF